MKEKLSLLIFCLTISGFAHSQYRILLDSTNTYKYNTSNWEPSYLIDIPLKEEIKSLYIDDSKDLIPIDLLLDSKHRIWSAIDTLIILAKNNSVARDTTDSKDVLYEYILTERVPMTKSKNRIARFSKYKLLSQRKEKSDSILVYYSEVHGSSCCPRDSTWDFRPYLDEYIQQFEAKYKVKIGRPYVKVMGFEGEGIVYLTLDGLTPFQKIDFNDTRLRQRYHGSATVRWRPLTVLYMPFYVPKINLKGGN